jgi:hypothetical protein
MKGTGKMLKARALVCERYNAGTAEHNEEG